MDPARFARDVFTGPTRTFAVRLWDGTELAPEREVGVRGRLVLRRPSALEAFLPPAAERRLAEAFIDGALDVEGDTVGVLEAAACWEGPKAPALSGRALVLALRRALRRGPSAPLLAELSGRRHEVGRDREAVRHHYDVSDDLYRLFLDEAMVYSCAYFASGHEGLEEAQRDKLELVCRKLGLGRGERFLDLGCGWGALVAHAAAVHGARALGATVSANQLAAARARAQRLGAGDEVRVTASDYRQLRADGPFDKVASIGMMEHVGRARLGTYFRAVHQLLRPGGLFLNQAVADAGPGPTLPWTSQRGGGFVWQYVFPDADTPPIGEVISAAERAGFEVRDLESLREHYEETLRHWLSRLEARFAEAVAAVGEPRARLYRLYLAGCAVGFRLGKTSVYQLLLAKPTEVGRAEGVPRCRADWYRGLDRAANEPGAERTPPLHLAPGP